MTTPILIMNQITNLSNTAARFFPLQANGGAGAAGSINNQTPMPTAGTISKLFFSVGTTVATGSYNVVIAKNGINTSLTCTISSGTTASDIVNSVSVVPGDVISVTITPTGTPTAQTSAYIGVAFDGTVDSESVILGGAAGLPSTATTVYVAMYMDAGPTSTESAHSMVFPTSGTIDQLYVQTSNTPNGVGNSWTFTLRKGGADTGLTCSIANTAQTGNDTNAAHAVSVAPGDLIDLAVTGVGTPRSAVNMSFGFRFIPTVKGESVMLANTIQGISAGSNTFLFTGGAGGNNTTESIAASVAPVAFTWKSLYLDFNTAPGSGTSRTFSARVNSVTQSLSATASNTATTANDTSNTVSVSAGDLLSWTSIPTNAPTGSVNIRMGAVMFVGASQAPFWQMVFK